MDLNWKIPERGETIAGKYVIQGPLGRGGLAAVLSAVHPELDRRVAIKVLLPEWAGDRRIVERFLREGRAATRIRSEHCVQVYDVGTTESGAPFLVLEYLDGQNLDEVLGSWGPLPVPTAVDWVLQATEAIAEAHAHGIVHRDLKPANLFLTRRLDGTACIKVIDFGLSKLKRTCLQGEEEEKLTRPTDVLGSPNYMAPEQLRASCDADERTDLWALGAVLYELLAAQPPFRGGSVPELCAAVLVQPPPPISSLRENVPLAIEDAVLRCLEKEPDARYANVAELARALAPYGSPGARASCGRIERILGVVPMPTGPASLPPLGAAERMSDPWPSDAYVVRHRLAAPVSGKIVAGSFFVLAGLAIAVFMGLYASVHSHDSERRGATNMQPLPTLVTMTPQEAASAQDKSTHEPTVAVEPKAAGLPHVPPMPKATEEPRAAAAAAATEPKPAPSANPTPPATMPPRALGASPGLSSPRARDRNEGVRTAGAPSRKIPPAVRALPAAQPQRPPSRSPSKAQPLSPAQPHSEATHNPTLAESLAPDLDFPPSDTAPSSTTSPPAAPPSDDLFETRR